MRRRNSLNVQGLGFRNSFVAVRSFDDLRRRDWALQLHRKNSNERHFRIKATLGTEKMHRIVSSACGLVALFEHGRDSRCYGVKLESLVGKLPAHLLGNGFQLTRGYHLACWDPVRSEKMSH